MTHYTRFSIFTLFALLLLAIPFHAQAGWGTSDGWDTTTTKFDIAYGSHDLQTLDIYSPRGTGVGMRPVFVFIHGGAWRFGDKKRFDDHGRFYNDNGILFVPINYRLAPDHLHPDQAQDSAAAVKWVYDNIEKYGGDKNKIYIGGHSAGAHLAALIASDPSYLMAHDIKPRILKSVIAVDTAAYDLTTPSEHWRINKAIDENFGTDKKAKELASPLYFAKNGTADLPAFTLFVTDKRPEAVIDTKRFYAALKEAGAYADIHIIDGLSHRGMSKAMAEPDSQVAQGILKTILD